MNNFILVVLFSIAALTNSFIVIPYQFLDLSSQLKLARCQAKCAAKHGTIVQRRQNIGKFVKQWLNSNELAKKCESNCTKDNIEDMMLLKKIQSVQYLKNETKQKATFSSCSLRSVVVKCATAQNMPYYADSFTVTVAILDDQCSVDTPVRYIIQWKQKSLVKGFDDETPWITAAIESIPLFTIEALVPFIQYKLLVWKVNQDGIVGRPVESVWFEVSSMNIKQNRYNFEIGSFYDAKNGVSFLLRGPMTATESDVHTVIEACEYGILLENSTHRISETFVIDDSKGLILPHLQYSSEYTLSVHVWNNNTVTDRSMSLENMVYSTKRTTPSCEDHLNFEGVQCEFKIYANFFSDGLIKVEWNPPISSQRIYIYRLEYATFFDREGNEGKAESVEKSVEFLDADSRSVIIRVPYVGAKRYTIQLTCFNKRIEGIEAKLQFDNQGDPVQYQFQLETQILLLPLAVLSVLLLSGYCCCRFFKKKLAKTAPTNIKTVVYYI